MSRGQKLKCHGTVVRISQQYNQPWRGFTLQKGHLYGEDERGYFVSAARPGKEPLTILVYRCDKSDIAQRGDYVWRLREEDVADPTPRKIIAAAGDRCARVEYEPVEKQVESFYHPRLTSAPPRPMTYMRAPGGTYGTCKTKGEVKEGKFAHMVPDAKQVIARFRGCDGSLVLIHRDGTQTKRHAASAG